MDERITTMKSGSKRLKVAITMLDGESSLPLTLHGMMEITESQMALTQGITSSSHQIKALIDRLQRIHDWEYSHLPHWTPRLSHELFRLLGGGKPNDQAFTVKEIVHATGFSERAVRKQLASFEAHGWITKGQNHLDRRNTHIKPSAQMKDAYQYWLSLHFEQ